MALPQAPLPTDCDAITVETLTLLASGNAPGAEAEALLGIDPIWGTATKIRVGVRWNAAGRAAGLPERVLIKGGFAEHRIAMSFLYQHEAHFYDRVQPRIGVNSPRCFGVAHDDASAQHLVLMEDLDAAGARFCRVVDPLPIDRVCEFLDIFAAMHAHTWGGNLLGEGGLWNNLREVAALPVGIPGDYARGQMVPETYARFMRLPRSLAVSRTFHDIGRMRRAMERIDHVMDGRPHCLVHGDAHMGNLYIDSEDRGGVLDWQCWCRGNWSFDITYFMLSALDQADRRRSDRALLAFYLERLAAHGCPQVPTMREALEAFRIQIAYGLFFWMVNPPDWQTEENNSAVAARFADAALDHGTFDDL